MMVQRVLLTFADDVRRLNREPRTRDRQFECQTVSYFAFGFSYYIFVAVAVLALFAHLHRQTLTGNMKLDKQQEAQSAAAGDSISSVGVPVNVKDYSPSEVFTEPLPVSEPLPFFTFKRELGARLHFRT